MTPRLILAAYQCAPEGGSVSQIGWEWYSRLARRLPVTLVTHARNGRILERAGAPVAGSQLVQVDTEWFAGPLYRLASRLFPRSEHAVFMLASLDFFLYDQQAWRQLRHLRQARPWDLVHVVTPVSVAMPTRLYRLGLPVVVGPLNSGLRTPTGFPEILRREPTWLYSLRNGGVWIDRLTRSSRRAAVVLAATGATREALPARVRPQAVSMLENGVDLQRFQATPWPEPPSARSPLRVLFVGRLIACKGVSMLLEAIARLRPAVAVELRIVGAGPMQAEWERRTADLGLGQVVSFLGAQPLTRVAEETRWCHVLCLPSVRESGGSVLIEAMAAARPVVAVSYGGPAEVVDDAVGRALAPRDTGSVTAALADTLRDIVQHPEAWRQRGLQGRQRAADEYDWERKIDRALVLYEQVLARRPGSPRCPPPAEE